MKTRKEEREIVTLSLSGQAVSQLQAIRRVERTAALPVTEIKKMLLASLDDETAVRHKAVNAAMQEDDR